MHARVWGGDTARKLTHLGVDKHIIYPCFVFQVLKTWRSVAVCSRHDGMGLGNRRVDGVGSFRKRKTPRTLSGSSCVLAKSVRASLFFFCQRNLVVRARAGLAGVACLVEAYVTKAQVAGQRNGGISYPRNIPPPPFTICPRMYRSQLIRLSFSERGVIIKCVGRPRKDLRVGAPFCVKSLRGALSNVLHVFAERTMNA